MKHSLAIDAGTDDDGIPLVLCKCCTFKPLRDFQLSKKPNLIHYTQKPLMENLEGMKAHDDTWKKHEKSKLHAWCKVRYLHLVEDAPISEELRILMEMDGLIDIRVSDVNPPDNTNEVDEAQFKVPLQTILLQNLFPRIEFKFVKKNRLHF